MDRPSSIPIGMEEEKSRSAHKISPVGKRKLSNSEIRKIGETMGQDARTQGKGEHEVIYFYDKVSDLVNAHDIYLNNFYNSPFTVDGFTYPTLEHFYQASKFDVADPKGRTLFKEIRDLIAPKEAHSLGRRYERERRYGDEKYWEEWKTRKIAVMRKGIECKFGQNPHLHSKLMMTKNAVIIQYSPSDKFWGGSLPGSENILGSLLMEYRSHQTHKNVLVPIESEGDQDREFVNNENVKGKQALINEMFMIGIRDMMAKSQSKKMNVQGEGRGRMDKSVLVHSDSGVKRDIELLIVKMSPFMYLGKEEKNILLKEGSVESFAPDSCILCPSETGKDDDNSCYILLSGEVLVYSKKHRKFIERLTEGSFFGQDGPLFDQRLNYIQAFSQSKVFKISQTTFFRILTPNSLFAKGIAHNLIHKHNIFRDLVNLKVYISHLWAKEMVDLDRLVHLYTKINSALHPHMRSADLDISSWMYAIRRLPANITECFCFFISTKCPELLSHPDIMLPIKSHARPRAIFQVIKGKSIVMLRDLVTDLQDFLMNLCIHIIESRKLIGKLLSPQIVRDLLVSEDEEKTKEALRSCPTGGLSEAEISGLADIWPVNLAAHLANIMLHYNDYQIMLKKPVSYLKPDPVEQWSSQLWKNVGQIFGLPASTLCGELSDEDFMVDIFQGSRRSFLNMISPHQYIKREKVMEWAKANNPAIKTRKFLCEEDKLNAMYFHYLLSETQENQARVELEKEFGIYRIEETYLTGIMVVIVNVNKINSNFTDPAFTLKPKSKYHLMVNIGYTFGTQSKDIARALLSLFGRKIRSFNIIGKAGGLTGNRGDILVCNKLYTDDTDDAVNNELGAQFDRERLQRRSQTGVHVGPMLTVAGTILQNSLLLNYYKRLWNCVGLEMEGYYYGNEIAKYKKMRFVRSDMVSRFAYYVSDLPLDPESNLSMEEGLISWDEGVPSISAIYRYFLELLFPKQI